MPGLMGRRPPLPVERMTPIRIRGKKGQRAKLRALQQQKILASKNSPDIEQEDTAAVAPGQLRSKFESLPNEILQFIFLLSRGLALPRASQVLAHILSSDHVKVKFIRSVFTDSSVKELSETSRELARLQTAVLRCRGVTVDIIKRSLGGKQHKFQTHPDCEIPTRVLHGPWTDERINLLGYLTSTGMRLDWERSSNGEVADESFREAILQGNLPVFFLLEKLILQSTISTAVRTQENFRLAVIDGGCNMEIVEYMFQKSRKGQKGDILDLDDDGILDWAVEKEAAGDERGTWLLHKIAVAGKNGRKEGPKDLP